MVVDQANYFQFALDDIEEAHSHVSFMDLATAGADELLAANKLTQGVFGGSTAANSIPVTAGGGAGALTSPLAVLNRMARLMDAANVDTDGRWIVVDPVFKEILMDEDAKLVNADFGGDAEVRNGRLPGTIRGFRVYQSNNLPYKGTGAGTSAAAGSATNFGVLVAGHDKLRASAHQIHSQTLFVVCNSMAAKSCAQKVSSQQTTTWPNG